MSYLITYKCQNCSVTMEWVYEQENGLTPSGLRGCPGKGCSEIHELHMRDIDENEVSEYKSGELYSI